ncbi:hypothetical protein SDC9_194820 [bioreactor metagenome]|uniref:Uncharacterized protein n=1 Tax=bioreactor metagenome TaxID=1076179 RepID=A0A645I9W8_9ZZZZ
MLDIHRAMFHTSAAIGAIPNDFAGNDVINQALFHGIYFFSSGISHSHFPGLRMRSVIQYIRSLLIQVFLHSLNESHFGIQGLAGVISRTIFLTPSAADASIQIQ